MRGTEKALMARGLDAHSAKKFVSEGWTINKLKVASESELKGAGFADWFINLLFKEARPPIPNDTLMSVLFANRYQCCVCRDRNLSVIVHHIEEWSKSKNHDITNLAVLCLHHHDEAHSKKTLSQNLDAAALRGAKEKWEVEVKRLDAESILAAMRLDYSSWNYINELRVFEIAKVLEIPLTKFTKFSDYVSANIIQSNGLPSPIEDEDLYYMYQGSNILQRYSYVSYVLKTMIQRLPITNVSDFLDKGVLGNSIVSGDFIFVQGKHVFSPVSKKKNGTGRGQICKGVRKANNVEVRFTFDRWEATSSSAKCEWLSGTKDQGSLVHVKDLSREEGRLIITGTVLGICSNQGGLKTREYAQSLFEDVRTSRYHFDEEDEDEGLDEA
jgi:hypothetical protein